MSGGSYDYLCFKDAEELCSSQHQSNLEAMSQRLGGLGYAEDAARETEELLLIIRQSMIRIQVRAQRLSEVWRAVEWWDSGDSSEDGLKQSLDRYRKDT